MRRQSSVVQRSVQPGTFVWTFCLAITLIVSSPAAAQGTNSVLVVGSSDVALQVAASLPTNAPPEGPRSASLTEIDHPETVIPAQLVPQTADDGTVARKSFRVVASIPPAGHGTSDRRFRLGPPPVDQGEGFRIEDVSQQSVGLFDGNQPVLVYNHGVITCDAVPETDRRRSRSCYVHPVYGLDGEVLTDDFPRDHYHHHGIFWTWPHVKVGAQEFDLWADRGIKQKFVEWLCRETGSVSAAIGVENGWYASDKKVMIERVWLRTYKPAGGTRSVDIEFTWIPVDEAIALWGAGGKSYGGLTIRFAPPSRGDPNTVITVPSGRTSADLPDTPLEWADFTSIFGDMTTPSGAAIFVHPDHPDYPPTWLTRHYGPLCVGWPGIKAKTFPAGQPIRLNYRVWIHQGPVEPSEIAQAYRAYQSALQAKWIDHSS